MPHQARGCCAASPKKVETGDQGKNISIALCTSWIWVKNAERIGFIRMTWVKSGETRPLMQLAFLAWHRLQVAQIYIYMRMR